MKHVSLLVFSLMISHVLLAQSDIDLLVSKTLQKQKAEKSVYRDERGFTMSYNPIKLAGNSFLWVYQKVFSEQINAGCGFSLSCSSFAKDAINQRGVIKGIFLAADRLMRCNGGAHLECEAYLVEKKTGKLRDVPGMYRLRD